MEYCATTLRKLIDDRSLSSMESNNKLRLLRQILEALVYMHGRNIIHRDLVSSARKPNHSNLAAHFPCKKPGNIFVDAEGNIRLGDFGLATRRREKEDAHVEDEHQQEMNVIYDAIDDIRGLMGNALNVSTSGITQVSQSTVGESLTGGVGTTLYRAPEQEGKTSTLKGDGGYNMKADIYSLGIILFEMFHPPFETVSHLTVTNLFLCHLTSSVLVHGEV